MNPAGIPLLDVNVLVALGWPNHVHHQAARDWFSDHHEQGWATTPITESGFVRVSSSRAAMPTATTPPSAIRLLTALTAVDGHEFWADNVQGVTGPPCRLEHLVSYRDVTDAHLLSLALARGGRLVTLDRRIRRLLADPDSPHLDILGAGSS